MSPFSPFSPFVPLGPTAPFTPWSPSPPCSPSSPSRPCSPSSPWSPASPLGPGGQTWWQGNEWRLNSVVREWNCCCCCCVFLTGVYTGYVEPEVSVTAHDGVKTWDMGYASPPNRQSCVLSSHGLATRRFDDHRYLWIFITFNLYSKYIIYSYAASSWTLPFPNSPRILCFSDFELEYRFSLPIPCTGLVDRVLGYSEAPTTANPWSQFVWKKEIGRRVGLQ